MKRIMRGLEWLKGKNEVHRRDDNIDNAVRGENMRTLDVKIKD